MTEVILVEAYCLDGALFSACSRLHRQYMASFHHQMKSQVSEGDHQLGELIHWFVSMRCAMHLAHGALKRGIQTFSSDKFVLKSAWVTLASLRSSLPPLIRRGPILINQRLVFEDWAMPFDSQEQLWRIFGIESDVCDQLLDLQLRWDPVDQKLKVAVKHL